MAPGPVDGRELEVRDGVGQPRPGATVRSLCKSARIQTVELLPPLRSSRSSCSNRSEVTPGANEYGFWMTIYRQGSVRRSVMVRIRTTFSEHSHSGSASFGPASCGALCDGPDSQRWPPNPTRPQLYGQKASLATFAELGTRLRRRVGHRQHPPLSSARPACLTRPNQAFPRVELCSRATPLQIKVRPFGDPRCAALATLGVRRSCS